MANGYNNFYLEQFACSHSQIVWDIVKGTIICIISKNRYNII